MPALPADRIVGLVLLIGGAALFAQTFSFRVVDWAPLGLAFWPRLVLGLLMTAGAWMVFKGRLDEGPARPLQTRAFLVLGGFFAYVLLLEPLGFLVATPLYIASFHLALGGVSARRLVEAAVLAVAGTGLVFYVFQDLLLVQFPDGLMRETL